MLLSNKIKFFVTAGCFKSILTVRVGYRSCDHMLGSVILGFFCEAGHVVLLPSRATVVLTVLPLWSCPLSSILLLTSSQSCTTLPRVIEPPSPTSTEGPDATDSDYTASSSSSSFSLSSSSSFYATSSSSTSEKVSQLDIVSKDGKGLLVWKLLVSFSFHSLVCHNPCPAYCYSPPFFIFFLSLYRFLFSSFAGIPSKKWDVFRPL